MEDQDDTLPAGNVLAPGSTCWRVESADQLAVIVDAADYFAIVRAAILEARHSVFLIGWDFDTRVVLDHTADDGAPVKLGRFLSWIAGRRPDLSIYLLKWDSGLLFTLTRGATPLFIIDWITRRNVKFRLDGHHPPLSAHHQKIVVIDDVLAFCGGIDITADRWDTRRHLDDDPRRVRPTSRRHYGPWHDATLALDGPAAAALGDMARVRWKRATGETVEPPERSPPIWPAKLEPSMRNVSVGISRTLPDHGEQREIREIEALYLGAIKAAKHSIYMESQYFASRRIAEALAARLAERDGPEIVLVNPETADGWLEEKVMGSARARLLRMIETADADRRFAIFTPVTSAGQPIYVHAKILIVDDWLFRLGSSNLNNRSMGYDSECDVTVEAGSQDPGHGDLRATILRLRNDLLAEHLGRPAEEVASTIERLGLLGAIEFLRGTARTLVPFDPPEISGLEEEIGKSDLLDPETAARPLLFSGRVFGREAEF